MAWSPISLTVPQYSYGTPPTLASGYVLKAYQAGTTTNISMATDDTGGTTFTDISLNSEGYPEHSGAIVIPHVDQEYKLSLYATQAAADADTPAVWSIDNLTPVSTSGAFLKNDSTANDVTNVVTLTHSTTGTPSAGIGTGLAFVTETSTDNNETGMVFRSVATDVSAGSEDFKLVLQLMAAGAAASDVFEVTALGSMKMLKANPEIIGGDTDGVFTFGANTNALGAVIKLYGDTHATKAGDIEILSDTTVVAHYDLSATKWDFGNNALECGSLKLPSGATITAILDEDDMSSDSATAVPTQQSAKAYMDTNSSKSKDTRDGLRLSNNSTDSDHDIDITTGVARDSSNSTDLTLTSALTKRLDASWASGTGNGGLSSSLTLSNNTWYHAFIVLIGGDEDVLFDTSTTCSNGVTDHSVTKYRWIGSVLTDGSANVVAFEQRGRNDFRWDVVQQDVAASTPGTSAVTATLTVPTGFEVDAYVNFSVAHTATYQGLLTSPSQTDTAPSGSAFDLNNSISDTQRLGVTKYVTTNTSAQVRYRFSADVVNAWINTIGWRMLD